MNRGETSARVLIFSNASAPAVSVYPDSDKVGVFTDAEDEGLFFKRASAVAWEEGEQGWENAG